MFAYVIRRLLSGAIMLLAMSLVTMLLFFASPADPAARTCGKNCSPELIEQNRKALGYPAKYDGNPVEHIKNVFGYWADFAGGIFVGSEFPKDPALKKAAPQLIAECSAPCLGYSPMANRRSSTRSSRSCRCPARSRSRHSSCGSSPASPSASSPPSTRAGSSTGRSSGCP